MTIDEPEYRQELEAWEESRDGLVDALRALQRAGFEEDWRSRSLPLVQEALPSIRQVLGALSIEEVEHGLQPFLGAEAFQAARAPVFVARYNQPYAISLADSGALIHYSVDLDGLWPLVLHERLHRMNPSRDILALYRDVGARNAYLGRRQKAIQDTFHEGIEEELVLAAELLAAERLGLMTRERALRRALTAFGGAPVAALLYDRLRLGLFPGSCFLEEAGIALEELAAAGDADLEYAALVYPVSGTLGFRLELREGRLLVAAVAPEGAASRAGILVGDELVAIDGVPPSHSLQETMSRLVGPPGTAVSLRLASPDGRLREVPLRREPFPGLPTRSSSGRATCPT
ncbi:MAG: PDZ domain-containing protein [Candidatus Eremiobacterota bacterium]